MPSCVIATAGTTSTGSTGDRRAILAPCRREGLWFRSLDGEAPQGGQAPPQHAFRLPSTTDSLARSAMEAAISFYDHYIPPMIRGLNALSKILEKAEAYAAERKFDPQVLLSARLFPDMYPLTRQVQIACDTARRGSIRLSGGEPPSVPDTETTFAELKARIAATLEQLNGYTPADFDGAAGLNLTIKAGPRVLTFTGTEFATGFSLPNFYFHLTTAYAILRHNGLELSKPEFLGG